MFLCCQKIYTVRKTFTNIFYLNFEVLHLTFNSLTCLECVYFVHDVKEGTHIIFFIWIITFFYLHLLPTCSFSLWYGLPVILCINIYSIQVSRSGFIILFQWSFSLCHFKKKNLSINYYGPWYLTGPDIFPLLIVLLWECFFLFLALSKSMYTFKLLYKYISFEAVPILEPLNSPFHDHDIYLHLFRCSPVLLQFISIFYLHKINVIFFLL